MKRRWAAFISGRGSTLQALLDCSGEIDIALVCSNQEEARGLKRAHRAGIPTLVLNSPIDWSQVQDELESRRVTHLFLLGFMKLLPPEFVARWKDRILNVHPSLLPSYKGLKAVERSFADGAPMGVTIHIVTAEMDEGPLLRQSSIEPGSTLLETQTRIAECEQRLIRKVVTRMNGDHA